MGVTVIAVNRWLVAQSPVVANRIFQFEIYYVQGMLQTSKWHGNNQLGQNS